MDPIVKSKDEAQSIPISEFDILNSGFATFPGMIMCKGLGLWPQRIPSM